MDYLARSGLCKKKHRRDRLIEVATRYGWVIGFMDEIWWSRFALPQMHEWGAEHSVRLVEQTPRKDDPDPQALACYGLWWANAARMLRNNPELQTLRVLQSLNPTQGRPAPTLVLGGGAVMPLRPAGDISQAPASEEEGPPPG